LIFSHVAESAASSSFGPATIMVGSLPESGQAAWCQRFGRAQKRRVRIGRP
jgi:hypothetical protein